MSEAIGADNVFFEPALLHPTLNSTVRETIIGCKEIWHAVGRIGTEASAIPAPIRTQPRQDGLRNAECGGIAN